MPINYKEYHPDWKTVIRPAILAREENKCKWCGVTNYAVGHRDLNGDWHDERSIDNMNSDVGYSYFGTFHLKMIKIILTIAHVDHDKKNNDYENLAALCQRCHLNHDRDHHRGNLRETIRKKKGLQKLF